MNETPTSLRERAYGACRLACRAILLQTLILLAFRAAFLVRHAGADLRLDAADVARTLLMGARFDLKVAALAAVPVVVVAGAWPAGRRRAAAVAVALGGFACALAGFINDGYFAYFHAPFDPVVFGLFEDDTAAIFRSLWEEHHLVLTPMAAVAIACAQAWLVLRPARRRPSPRLQLLLAAALPALLFVLIRGRLTGAPIHDKDFAVSTERFLNAAVPNGVIALHVAAGDRSKSEVGDDPYAGLRKAGFARPAEAAAVLGLTPPDAPDAAVTEALYTRTPRNPQAAAHPPHVILVVMESWGADLLRHATDRNDVLGRLRPHLQRGLLFRRFVAGANSTDPTLEALVVATPFTPLLPGPAGHARYEQASARPFQAAGYRTVFGIGWNRVWRGIGRAYPNQGFDEVADVTDVVAAVPGAVEGTWGVPDAALFAWAMGRLRQADQKGERLLMVLVSATNHTPYVIPDGYTVGPLDPSALAGRTLGDPALVIPQLATYQYACDALGGFLDQVHAAGLSDRTIVAATGDHNLRELFQYPGTADLPWRDRVPLFLQVPPAYLEGRPPPDLDRWAGHRDIFPTLAGLALSEARIYRTGEDLLSPPTRPPRALARFETVLSDAGVTPDLGAADALCWGADGELRGEPAAPCREAIAPIAREERALVALHDWDIRRQAIDDRHRLRRSMMATAAAGPPAPGSKP